MSELLFERKMADAVERVKSGRGQIATESTKLAMWSWRSESVGSRGSQATENGSRPCRWARNTRRGSLEGNRKEIKRAGLSLRSPFAKRAASQIANHFRGLVWKLRERYSVHNFRHAFAVCLYEETRDNYQVEREAGLANVAVAEAYLKFL